MIKNIIIVSIIFIIIFILKIKNKEKFTDSTDCECRVAASTEGNTDSCSSHGYQIDWCYTNGKCRDSGIENNDWGFSTKRSKGDSYWSKCEMKDSKGIAVKQVNPKYALISKGELTAIKNMGIVSNNLFNAGTGGATKLVVDNLTVGGDDTFTVGNQKYSDWKTLQQNTFNQNLKSFKDSTYTPKIEELLSKINNLEKKIKKLSKVVAYHKHDLSTIETMWASSSVSGSGTSVTSTQIPKSTTTPFIYTIKERDTGNAGSLAYNSIIKLNLRDAISKYYTKDDYYIVNYSKPDTNGSVVDNDIKDISTISVNLHSKTGNDNTNILAKARNTGHYFKNSHFKYGLVDGN